jgi:hypothetical protein
VPVVDTVGLKTDSVTGISWIRARCAAGIVKPADLCAAVLSDVDVLLADRAHAVISIAPIVRLSR